MSYIWPFCLSDWIFKSLLPVTIGLIRALGRFGFPDNYLITRLLRSGHGGPKNCTAFKLCYLWFASYIWPFCPSDWIFKSLLPVTIGLIRALGRFGFPDNYLITRLFPQEAPPPSPASQLVTTKQSFSNFRYLFI